MSVHPDLDRRDLVALAPILIVERDDRVLDGDEVAVAEIPGGAVARFARRVVGVQLDEAFLPIAQQADRHQSHFALELPLDLFDQRRLRTARGHDFRLAPPVRSGWCGRGLSLTHLQNRARHVVTQRADACVVTGELLRDGTLRAPAAEAERERRERERETGVGNRAAHGHWVLRIPLPETRTK